MNPFLVAAETLYCGLNRVRRALYRRGILKAKRLSKPVLSIGNISAGGAGKTPATIAIARYLASRGMRVAVLTRGYGRRGSGGRVTSLDAERYGDEPVLIKKRLPFVDVIVGSNRYEMALGNDADVFVLDDGFQHLQLHRDADVVIDVPRPRFLREGRPALRHAGIVLRRDLRLDIPATLRGRRIFAFSGLADNEQFFRSLREEGLDLAGTKSFPDHHRYTASSMQEIREAASTAGAEVLVTTEKDAVKLEGDDIVAIPAEMVIDDRDLERIAALVLR